MQIKDVADWLVPIASLWVIHGRLVDAAKFVNEMRDLILFGYKDSIRLTMRHREAMRLDWILSMCGTVATAFLFSGLVGLLGWMSGAGESRLVAYSLFAVAGFAAGCGLLFVTCGLSDYRAMKAQIKIDSERQWDSVARNAQSPR